MTQRSLNNLEKFSKDNNSDIKWQKQKMNVEVAQKIINTKHI